MDFDTSLVDARTETYSHISHERDIFASLAYCKTLSSSVDCRGVGIHNGVEVSLSLLPAEAGTGIVFRRLDKISQRAEQGDISAIYSNVVDGQRCTVIANEFGVTVSTIEHICSALVAKGISDVIVALDGDEVPIMDGSARDFLSMIDSAGVKDLPVRRQFLRVVRPIEVLGDKAGVSASLDISDDSLYSYELDYDILGRQLHDFSFSAGDFANDIGSARTFGFESELAELRSKGCAMGASYDNTVAFGSGGVLNEGGLRYANEPARHKVLDAIGDLALSGYFIIGKFRGVRSGHRLNNELLHALFADSDNFEIF